ncbi:MAG: hypothetical protein EP330_12980 [Deltaproteobacteria bacterium]|nr:MAG: hypothetical protein EP330_12980 [Deltaproteobacteria bacterium]
MSRLLALLLLAGCPKPAPTEPPAAAVEPAPEPEAPADPIEARFQQADASGDGAIQREELVDITGGDGEATELIAMFDVNGNAQMDRDEFGAFARSTQSLLEVEPSEIAQYPRYGANAAASFAYMDANKDGAVTPDEVGPEAGLLDTDGSGDLSAAEIEPLIYATIDVAFIDVLQDKLHTVGSQTSFTAAHLARAVRLLPEDFGAGPEDLAAHDADGNGELAGDELRAWLIAGAEQAQWTWADANGDGMVDGGELATRMVVPKEAQPSLFKDLGVKGKSLDRDAFARFRALARDAFANRPQ